jgi:RES domain-containing protein
MKVYRIAKKKERANDLSGTGAYNEGGRWNSEGVFALYTSENSALAMLEVLVHVEEYELPPHLFIMTIEIPDDVAVKEMLAEELPENWRIPENLALKNIGDELLKCREFLALKVPSAVMPSQYNFVLNPLFPGYYDLVKVIEVEDLLVDERYLN